MRNDIKITQPMIDGYGKINGDNDIVHYDHDYAVKRGFRGTLLHGPHMSAFAAELGARKYGADWLKHGRLHTKWIGPSCPDDVFTVEIDDSGAVQAISGGNVALVGSVTLRP